MRRVIVYITALIATLLAAAKPASASLLGNIRYASTGLAFYDSYKGIIDFVIVLSLFTAILWIAVNKTFSESGQRNPAIIVSLLLAVTLTIATIKAGLGPEFLAPFMHNIIFFFIVGGIYLMAVALGGISSPLGKIATLLIAALATFLMFALTNMPHISGSLRLPGGWGRYLAMAATVLLAAGVIWLLAKMFNGILGTGSGIIAVLFAVLLVLVLLFLVGPRIADTNFFSQNVGNEVQGETQDQRGGAGGGGGGVIDGARGIFSSGTQLLSDGWDAIRSRTGLGTDSRPTTPPNNNDNTNQNDVTPPEDEQVTPDDDPEESAVNEAKDTSQNALDAAREAADQAAQQAQGGDDDQQGAVPSSDKGELEGSGEQQGTQESGAREGKNHTARNIFILLAIVGGLYTINKYRKKGSGAAITNTAPAGRVLLPDELEDAVDEIDERTDPEEFLEGSTIRRLDAFEGFRQG